ncbi:unnamed protein product [Allacma fusca]|uniref:MIF4G domain-containing protein n=1 Tax=Allacma fusca TaxID=39272 RepID=A0A8J2P3X5_9HEXA|nr:unnamed protein product [Allacma fusca]
MDVEEKIRRLEEQFLSTNERITELLNRVVRVEELVTKHIVVGSTPEGKKPIRKSAQQLKKIDDGLDINVQNGTQKLLFSPSQDQQPGVPLADLLSKLVSANAYSKSNEQSVPKKTVTVFEENPWDIELDKIPWEGTGSFGTDEGHDLKNKRLIDPLAKTKQMFAPCRKVCGNLTGHPCRVLHDPSLSCPPCTMLIKNFKLKCNHRIDVLCHRQGKISEYCSECDAKRLVKVEQEKSVLSRPTLSLAMDPIQSESEVAFKKVKEILNKLTSSNFEKLSEDFITIVNAQTKYLPEIASVLIEKAMLDVETPLSPANYAKLASKTINRPQGELKMFRIEVVTLAVLIFTTVLFSKNTDGAANLPYFVKTLLKRKEISDLDPKRRNLGVLRFVGELFNQDVISACTLQTDVIDPLIANPSEENLDYLCKLLTLVGHKIHEKVTGTSSSSWFEGLFVKLKPFCDNTSISTQVRFSVQNLYDLKEVNWDRYKKPKIQSSSLKPSLDIGSTSSLLSNGSALDPSIPGKSRKARKKKQAPAVTKQQIKTVPVSILPANVNSSDIFDPWESVPWGEHTDPLAVAFPRLDSPGLLPGNLSSPSISGKATPSDLGWKGSQSSATFAKAMSTASSRVISPAISTTSLNSAHSSLPQKIDAVVVFNMYVNIHAAPQKNRIDLLSRKLAGCEDKQLRDFIRDLSRHSMQLEKKMKVAALGQLVDVLLKSKIVSEELVSKGFQSGVISDLPIMHKRRNILQYPETWWVFSTEVLKVVLERKKIKFAKNCFENTIEGRDYLRKQAVALKIADNK